MKKVYKVYKLTFSGITTIGLNVEGDEGKGYYYTKIDAEGWIMINGTHAVSDSDQLVVLEVYVKH